jgi:hypothetical protein
MRFRRPALLGRRRFDERSALQWTRIGSYLSKLAASGRLFSARLMGTIAFGGGACITENRLVRFSSN